MNTTLRGERSHTGDTRAYIQTHWTGYGHPFSHEWPHAHAHYRNNFEKKGPEEWVAGSEQSAKPTRSCSDWQNFGASPAEAALTPDILSARRLPEEEGPSSAPMVESSWLLDSAWSSNMSASSSMDGLWLSTSLSRNLKPHGGQPQHPTTTTCHPQLLLLQRWHTVPPQLHQNQFHLPPPSPPAPALNSSRNWRMQADTVKSANLPVTSCPSHRGVPMTPSDKPTGPPNQQGSSKMHSMVPSTTLTHGHRQTKHTEKDRHEDTDTTTHTHTFTQM